MERHTPSRLELRSVREILRRYCQALTGMDVLVRSTEELSQWGVGWTSIEQATTEGSTIFLPPTIPDSDSLLNTFEAYKVLATHQAGHLELGTFGFAFERPSTLFKDFRAAVSEMIGVNSQALTDFERFFDLFRNRRMAKDIFTIVEDGRVDFLLKREYNGIRSLYHGAQQKSLSERPELIHLPLREALLEILLQYSIDNRGQIRLPHLLVPWLRLSCGIIRRVQYPEAAVEDSTEATVRLYCLLAEVPNLPSSDIPPDQWGIYDLGETAEFDDDELAVMIGEFFADGLEGAQEDNTELYQSPKDLDFRGELKPELAQTLMKLGLDDNQTEGGEPGDETAQTDLRRLFEKSAEIAMDDKARLLPTSFARNMMKEGRRIYLSGEMTRPEQPRPRYGEGQKQGSTTQLIEDFYYDEWDYLAGHYKQRWCHLKQWVLEEGPDNFFAETLQHYSGLVTAVKKEFEHLKSENFRKVKRLPDGDDLDFDSVVDSLVQKKVGAPFSDRVYWRRKKVERDVCVAFLLDMSASTYERLGSNDVSSVSLLPTAGVWTGKRIIDLEKEAVIVLIEALESIGDLYGIYGFSGHSRHNVEFAIIKGVAEDLSPSIKRRVASICPVRGTRMGPAIRHLSSILERQEAKTKLLILISDGRPQDYDYGEHHAFGDWGAFKHLTKARSAIKGEITEEMRREYAVYDTRMALLEARQNGVKPFCLTIDKADHDYLRVMCGDIGYEVLDDIYDLPRRLPNLYRRLTTRI